MREIEIKIRVKNHAAIQAALKQRGATLSKPRKQRDVVFCLPGSTNDPLSANWLRIRTENDKLHTFTLKRSVVGQLDSIEHETKVSDPTQMETILALLGYEVYSDLTKSRQTAKYKDVEICLDYIKGLGYFVEAEKICPKDSDHHSVTNELWEVLMGLGVPKTDVIDVGYDVLERQQRGLSN